LVLFFGVTTGVLLLVEYHRGDKIAKFLIFQDIGIFQVEVVVARV